MIKPSTDTRSLKPKATKAEKAAKKMTLLNEMFERLESARVAKENGCETDNMGMNVGAGAGAGGYEEVLACTMVLTRLMESDDVSHIERLHKALGFDFLIQLLSSGYSQVALSILSVYSHVPNLADSDDMRKAIPLISKLLPQYEDDLDDVDMSDASQTWDDILECLTGVAITTGGVKYLCQRQPQVVLSVLMLLSRDVTRGCVTQLSELLCEGDLLVGLTKSEVTQVCNLYMVGISSQFERLDNIYKFRLCRILSMIITHLNDNARTYLHKRTRSNTKQSQTSIVHQHIKIGLMKLLTSKLDDRTRTDALSLASAMMEWTDGVQWMLLEEGEGQLTPSSKNISEVTQRDESMEHILPRAGVKLSEAYSVNTTEIDTRAKVASNLSLTVHLACMEVRMGLDAFQELDSKMLVIGQDTASKQYNTLYLRQTKILTVLSACFSIIETAVVSMVSGHPDDEGYEWLVSFANIARGPITECVQSVLEYLFDSYVELHDKSGSVDTNEKGDGVILASKLQPPVVSVNTYMGEQETTSSTSKISSIPKAKPKSVITPSSSGKAMQGHTEKDADSVSMSLDMHRGALQLACLRVVGVYFAEETDDLQAALNKALPALMFFCSTLHHVHTSNINVDAAAENLELLNIRGNIGKISESSVGLNDSKNISDYMALGMLLPMLLNVSCDTEGGGLVAFVSAGGVKVVADGLVAMWNATYNTIGTSVLMPARHDGLSDGQGGLAWLSYMENAVNVLLNVAVLEGENECASTPYMDVMRTVMQNPPTDIFLNACICALVAFTVKHTVAARNTDVTSSPGFRSFFIDILMFLSVTGPRLIQDCTTPIPTSSRKHKSTHANEHDSTLQHLTSSEAGSVITIGCAKLYVPDSYDYEALREPWFLCMQAVSACVSLLTPNVEGGDVIEIALDKSKLAQTLTECLVSKSKKQLKLIPDLVMACTGLIEAVETQFPSKCLST